MIRITRIVDKSVLDKVDTDKLREVLPEVDRDVALIICVTKKEREEDVWEKNGVVYVRVVLDYEEVSSAKKVDVLEMMKVITLKRLKEI